jgi:hypothetical protein
MRNHLDTSSAAQYLDGTRLTGRLQVPVVRHLRQRASERKSQRGFCSLQLSNSIAAS